ncbi:MAG: septum formation protein Maf [Clostridium sp.]|nr:septum formation protein Maf [Clostridium sp.]
MNEDVKNKRLILGSQSPRRHSLIKKLNVDFDVVSPDCDEKLDSDIYSDDKIKSLSLQKSLSILKAKNPANSLVISADTVVISDSKILGKPKDEAQAHEMLRALSGKTHYVVTAVTVLDCDTGKYLSDTVKTYVTFQDLSDELIDDYIKTFKPLDKAGAYGVQEMGPAFIKNVDGCLDNVIGLPVERLKQMLVEMGYDFSVPCAQG